jgi:hypothetical protein
MTMVPVAAAAAAAAAAADGGTAAAAATSDPQQQQTRVCVVANIETETHVPEAIIHFVLRVRPAAAEAAAVAAAAKLLLSLPRTSLIFLNLVC